MMNLPLRPDIGVAIVAPSGYAADDAALPRARAYLQSLGCRVMTYCLPAARHQRFADTDAGRVSQLHAAAADPDADIVLALRGGYGMSRLLDQLDFPRLAASGKIFVGHSDFTAFGLGLLARAGGTSFAGPMVCDDFARPQVSEFTMGHFWQCVSQPEYRFGFATTGPSLDVSGGLWGGNLTMVAHLVGSRYLPRMDGGILFLEDVNEHPYRVERMILQLLYGGVLDNQKAVLLGDFSEYKLHAYDNGYDFRSMLDYLRTRLPIPILTGMPFGHTVDKVTLPVGGRARVISDGQHCHLILTGHPVLSGQG